MGTIEVVRFLAHETLRMITDKDVDPYFFFPIQNIPAKKIARNTFDSAFILCTKVQHLLKV